MNKANHCVCGNYYTGDDCHECGRTASLGNTCTEVSVLYLTEEQASRLSTLLNIDLRNCGKEYRETMNPVFKQLAGRNHDSVKDLPMCDCGNDVVAGPIDEMCVTCQRAAEIESELS